jgi:hypothetical protein
VFEEKTIGTITIMLNLAIAVDIDRNNNSIIETNSGDTFVAPDWPQDCESQVVSYQKGSHTCRVVHLESFSEDVGQALTFIERAGLFAGKKPDWFVRLHELAGT